MVGSIDPRCETLRGTHWPKKGRLVVWNSRRGSHLGQRSTDRINRPDIWMQAIRSDRQKTLVARGPSTYGSLLSQGRHLFLPRDDAKLCDNKNELPGETCPPQNNRQTLPTWCARGPGPAAMRSPSNSRVARPASLSWIPEPTASP